MNIYIFIYSAMKETMYCPSDRLITKVKNIYVGEKLPKNQTITLQLTSTLYMNQEPIIFQVSKCYPWIFVSSYFPPFFNKVFRVFAFSNKTCSMLWAINTILVYWLDRQYSNHSLKGRRTKYNRKRHSPFLKPAEFYFSVKQVWLTMFSALMFSVGFPLWKGLAFPQILWSLW